MALGLFILALVLTGFVSVGSMVAAWSLGITAVWLWPLADPAVPVWIVPLTLGLLALAITWLHRKNIGRLVRGEENRFDKVWLLGRLLRR